MSIHSQYIRGKGGAGAPPTAYAWEAIREAVFVEAVNPVPLPPSWSGIFGIKGGFLSPALVETVAEVKGATAPQTFVEAVTEVKGATSPQTISETVTVVKT